MYANRYILERVQHISHPRQTVFAFFADASNLEFLTPDFLRFRILSTLPIAMHAGTLIDYQLRLFAFPIRWRTRIETFEAPIRFTDVQLMGPYRYWRHLHEFYEVADGTLVVDLVAYELPYGFLGALVHDVAVRRSLEQIFTYRRQQLERYFAGLPREHDSTRIAQVEKP